MEALIFFLKFWMLLCFVCLATMVWCLFMWPHHLVWPEDDQDDQEDRK